MFWFSKKEKSVGFEVRFNSSDAIVAGVPDLLNVTFEVSLCGTLGPKSGNSDVESTAHFTVDGVSNSVEGPRKRTWIFPRQLDIGDFISVRIVEASEFSPEMPDTLSYLPPRSISRRVDMIGLKVTINGGPAVIAAEEDLHRLHFHLLGTELGTKDFQTFLCGLQGYGTRGGVATESSWLNYERLRIGDILTIEVVDTRVADEPISNEAYEPSFLWVDP